MVDGVGSGGHFVTLWGGVVINKWDCTLIIRKWDP